MTMRKNSLLKLGSVTAAVAAATMWMGPAWGNTAHPNMVPGSGGAAAAPVTHAQPVMAHMGGGSDVAAGTADLTQQLAAARLATAKYATNLGKAKRDGYGIITPIMPNMGVHYMNLKISGFSITKPQILVYEKHGKSFQLGALEWVFPKMPANPPLDNATFGSFPAACHYNDGNFIPHSAAQGGQATCPKTFRKTGSKFHFWHPDLVTMHVWLWYPNPAGLYSSTNPLVAPFNHG
jgi:hypothetical protein